MGQWTRTSAPDPRGPVRRILSVERRTNGDYVTCDCGHTSQRTHADWSCETETRCFQCRAEASDRTAQEWADLYRARATARTEG